MTGRPKTQPWTLAEVERLRTLAPQGARAVAAALNRTEHSVRQAAKRHGVSLRQTGSRRGRIKGMPPDVVLRAFDPATVEQLRADLLTRRLDPGWLDEAIERAKVPPEQRVLCPSCAVREVDRRASGLCSVCHYRTLADAVRNRAAETEAHRELLRARQERSRQQRSRVDA